MQNKDIYDNKLSDEKSEEELQGVIDLYKTSNPDSKHEKEMLQSILNLPFLPELLSIIYGAIR